MNLSCPSTRTKEELNPQEQYYLAAAKRNRRASILYAWMALVSFQAGIGFIFMALPILVINSFLVTILTLFLAHEFDCMARFFRTISKLNKERNY